LVPAQEADSEARPLVATGRSEGNSGFTFKAVPPPANNDAATNARVTVVDGERDPNGGDLAVLCDGRVPLNDDAPRRNFFFRPGTDGGRIRIDLGRLISVKQVSSYSWHTGARAPQVYELYAADGTAADFQPEPKKGTDPASTGWTRIASVDTRPKEGDGHGQHGVAITDSEGVLGQFRYLLFDISRTEDRDNFGNTFYSEFDVLDANGAAPTSGVEQPILQSFNTDDDRFHFTVDATIAPDLADWSDTTLRPIICEWYPRIVAMLPSEGYEPRKDITIRFRDDMRSTPASAAGSVISLNAPWFRNQLRGEACGAVVHELVHVAQKYPVRRINANGVATPGWIIEGIADYIRWFLYEPQSRGAEITKRNFAQARYDSSYRITGNFLDWIAQTHGKDILPKLNAAVREGRYEEALWKEWTGKSVQELGVDWKSSHEQRLNGPQ
jgi:hypothetical protein